MFGTSADIFEWISETVCVCLKMRRRDSVQQRSQASRLHQLELRLQTLAVQMEVITDQTISVLLDCDSVRLQVFGLFYRT